MKQLMRWKHCPKIIIAMMAVFGSTLCSCERSRVPDQQENIKLASSTSSALGEIPNGCLRVNVTPSAITINDTSWHHQKGWAASHPTDNKVVSIALTQGRLPQPLKGGMLIKQLHTPLNARMTYALKHQDVAPSPLCFYIDGRVPYQTITHILYTAGQAMWSSFAFVVQDSHQVTRAFMHHAPKFCAAKKPAPKILDKTCELCQLVADQRFERGPRCLLSTVHLVTSGVAVTGRPGRRNDWCSFAALGVEAPSPQPTDRVYDLDDGVMIAPDAKSCPSVTTTTSQALSSFLKRLDRASPLCQRAQVVAESSINWARVVNGVGALHESGISAVTFLIGNPSSSCQARALLP